MHLLSRTLTWLLLSVAVSGCIDRSRLNPDCGWTGDLAGPLDLTQARTFWSFQPVKGDLPAIAILRWRLMAGRSLRATQSSKSLWLRAACADIICTYPCVIAAAGGTAGCDCFLRPNMA